MIRTRADLWSYIQADGRSRGVASLPHPCLFDPIFRFTVLLRVNEYLLNTHQGRLMRAVPYLLFKGLSIRLGFSVAPNVFGAGLAIVHYGLLVVSPSARVGKNCRVHAGVNIGGAAGFVTDGDTVGRAPIIGDNCYIGPGAKIFGGVVIGNSCVIGANAVVNRSFEADCVTIAGVPARIVAQAGSDGKVKLGAA